MGNDMNHGNILSNTAASLRNSYNDGPAWGTRKHPMPDPKGITDLFMDIRALMFPGYFDSMATGATCSDASCLLERLGLTYWRMAKQIHNTLADTCNDGCGFDCGIMLESRKQADLFLSNLISIRSSVLLDIEAAYNGDPAAKGFEEILLSYPGIYAITTHRLAHQFYTQGLTMMARMLSEHAHSITGIDIHPGAIIGKSFFIDHGTGVVIGETTLIGDRVKIYQGVTLGALSFPKDSDGKLIRDSKRHPTIEDDVTIYAGATILGGDTVVGTGSVIGGNVWLTESVPPMSRVLNKPTIELQTRSSAKVKKAQ